MKITALTAQIRDPERVNVSVDGKFRFSLDISQVVDLGIKQGQEISEERLVELEVEGQFGKLYMRALEYCLSRPHSERELRDYLYRKTLARRYKNKKGEIKEAPGNSQEVANRVFEKMVGKQYVHDENFAKWWVENRNQRKGTSRRKLELELRQKGVPPEIVQTVLQNSTRDERSELMKMIEKKHAKYADENKLIAYLVRQGFGYQDVKEALGDQQD